MKTKMHWLEVSHDRLDMAEDYDFVANPAAGAIDMFVGTVRNSFGGRDVLRMEYHGYPDMAEKILAGIADEAVRRWSLCRISIRHRLGLLELGEASVVIAVSSEHRAEAFEACRFVIEEIKRDLPVWKKEFFADGDISWKNVP